MVKPGLLAFHKERYSAILDKKKFGFQWVTGN